MRRPDRLKCLSIGRLSSWQNGQIKPASSKSFSCQFLLSPAQTLPSRPKVRLALSTCSPYLYSMQQPMPCQVRVASSLMRIEPILTKNLFCNVLSTGLRPYADSCGANRALWQDRFDAINALSSTEPPPPIKIAFNDTNSLSSLEDRYRNLFPLSLPRSMFQGSDIQSPAASTPSAQSIQSTAVDEAALHDTHSMRAAYIEHTTRRKSSVRIPTVRGRRFQE